MLVRLYICVCMYIYMHVPFLLESSTLSCFILSSNSRGDLGNQRKSKLKPTISVLISLAEIYLKRAKYFLGLGLAFETLSSPRTKARSRESSHSDR